MAWCKSFRIHPEHGVPDKDIRIFLSQCEKEAVVSVVTTYIPGSPEKGIDPRLNLIVTKLDELEPKIDITHHEFSSRV